ncbi:MAG: hypothetical protein H6641_04965 [Caldilineaceae bacterium]|nr:hypothetical protein [Caldilineaceae bacterium]
MSARKIFMLITTLVLITSVFVGTVNALNSKPAPVAAAHLENVRDYAAASTTNVDNAVNYAIDGGQLLKGNARGWQQIQLPEGVIASAVAADSQNSQIIYVGAANEMALYRSVDGGNQWQQMVLDAETVGGVTDIAVDNFQHLVYVGTDNAGVFRLRDVGSSMILGGHLLLDEPVLEVAADSTGAGLALVRTEWHLYRAENFGLSWVTVENLSSTPTAVAIANTTPATIYVGTTDRGLLKSVDSGFTWERANDGLGVNPGTRLHIDSLALDPAQPEVLYVATSYLFGSTTVHNSPSTVAVTADGAQQWTALDGNVLNGASVAALMPVTGETGAVYALTNQSRSPLALGSAPAPVLAETEPAVAAASPASNISTIIAWIVASLAALALLFAASVDMIGRRRGQWETLAPSFVRNAVK